MLRAVGQNCGFVIRAAKLNRIVEFVGDNGTFQTQPLANYLAGLPSQGEREIQVKATGKQAARVAVVSLRYGELTLSPPLINPALPSPAKSQNPSIYIKIYLTSKRPNC